LAPNDLIFGYLNSAQALLLREIRHLSLQERWLHSWRV
jgi:hypothetical protein